MEGGPDKEPPPRAPELAPPAVDPAALQSRPPAVSFRGAPVQSLSLQNAQQKTATEEPEPDMSEPDPSTIPTVNAKLAEQPSPPEKNKKPPAPPKEKPPSHAPPRAHGQKDAGKGTHHKGRHGERGARPLRVPPLPKYPAMDVPLTGTLAMPALLPKRDRDYDPGRARAEVGDIIRALRAHGAERIAHVQAGANAAKASTAAHALAQQHHVRGSVAQALAAIAKDIGHARTTIAAAAKVDHGLALGVAATGYSQLLLATSTQATTINTAKTTAEQNAHKAVADKQASARKIGSDEITRARNGMAKQAKEARDRAATKAAAYPYDERGEVQRKAVLNVGEEAAKKLVEPFPDIETKTREASDDLANSFGDAADKVIDGFNEQAPKVIGDLMQRALATEPDFQRVGKEAGDAMIRLQTGTGEQLDIVERDARSEVGSIAGAVERQITTTLRALHANIDAEAGAMITSISTLVERTATTALLIERPHVLGVRAAAAETTTMLDEGVTGFDEALTEMETSTADGLDEAGVGVASSVAMIAARVSAHLTGVVNAALKGLTTLVDKAQEGADAYNTAWSKVLADAQTSVEQAFADAIAKMRGEIDKTIAKGQPAIVEGVDKILVENAKILDGLDESMEKAADGARYKYDHPIKYKLKKALWAFLGGLLKLVAIVVLAIVALVLIFVGFITGAIWLLVIGVAMLVAVVGYVLYGLISGIVNRIRSADNWFDGIRGFFIGILDITGIPNIVEGLTEQDLVNGRELSLDEAGERLGGGVLGALTFFIPFIKGLKGLKGAKGGAGLPVEVPVDPVPIEGAPPVEVPIEGAPPVDVVPPEVKAPPEAPPPELRPVETPPPEVKPQEVPSEKPVEQKPVEQKPVEQKPAEQKPVEQKPVEQKPVEQKPVEQKPIEQKPVEEKPVEQKPTEEPTGPAEEPVSEDVSPEVAEAEKMVEAEGAEVEDRVEASTLEDIKNLEKPVKARPPSKLTGGMKRMWGDYVDYWKGRIKELKEFLEAEKAAEKAGKSVEGTKPRSPLTWEAYSRFRGRFLRGMEFQRRVTKALKGQFKKLKVEEEVAVESPKTAEVNRLRREAIEADPKGEGTRPAPTRADQVAIDKQALKKWRNDVKKNPNAPPPDVEAFSNKSRVVKEYPTREAFLEQVDKDARELVDKYSGEVEIRTEKFGPELLGKKVTVKKPHLVFEKGFLGDSEAAILRIEKAILEQVEEVKADTGVDIEVTFL